MADNHFIEIPSNQSPSTPSPSSITPLQLSGFFTGDTIQVHGDTHTLQFSVQFNIHHKQQQISQNHFEFPITTEDQISLNSANHFQFPPITNTTQYQDSPYSNSTYMTPIPTLEEEDQIANAHQLQSANGREAILTRLRSGVLSRVTYSPTRICYTSGGVCGRKKRMRKKRKAKEDRLERVLRRHCFPVRPCSSYAFFVMASWGFAKSKYFSFGETSKRLGKMWCKLPHNEKVYEDMALKDSARYKRQCNQLKNQIQIEYT